MVFDCLRAPSLSGMGRIALASNAFKLALFEKMCIGLALLDFEKVMH